MEPTVSAAFRNGKKSAGNKEQQRETGRNGRGGASTKIGHRVQKL
jgi:hypothetical protein